MFENLSIAELVLSGFGAIVIFILAFQIGKLMASRRSKREMKLIDKERSKSDRSFKALLDEEQANVLSEYEKLKALNELLMNAVDKYRSKLAGMGRFSLANARKRADLLYSLLMENEVLEQLLMEQSKMEPAEKSDYLLHQMKDVEKRHQVMAKIFDRDGAIKAHVKQRLFDDKRSKKPETEDDSEVVLEAPVKDDKVDQLPAVDN